MVPNHEEMITNLFLDNCQEAAHAEQLSQWGKYNSEMPVFHRQEHACNKYISLDTQHY